MNFSMKMFSFLILQIFLILPSIVWTQSISVPSGYSRIRNTYAYMADSSLVTDYVKQCIQTTNYPIPQQKQPISRSMEQLIEFVERLEEVLANTTDPILSQIKRPDDVARFILHRFHLDDVNVESSEIPQYADKKNEIDTKILGLLQFVQPNKDYYFPDNIYTQDELCSLFFMFSHLVINTTEQNSLNRKRRDVYEYNRNIRSYTDSGSNSASIRSSSTSFQSMASAYPIKENGVVTFHQNLEMESIAPAKVFIGIIAGLVDQPKLQITDLIQDVPDDIKQTALKDAVLSTTLANMAGSAVFSDSDKSFDEKFVFGLDGKWIEGPCCEYFAITTPISDPIQWVKMEHSFRGSIAQIRGSIDGYIIGTSLQKLKTSISNINQLKLSSILRSYYSFPHLKNGVQELSTSYCDRQNAKSQMNDLNSEATNYATIFKQANKFSQKFQARTDLLQEAINKAVQTQQEFCTMPSSSTDENSACETPSDLIFVIDPKQENINQTLEIINEIVRKLNHFGKYSGKISIFVNSGPGMDNGIQLPGGSWPFYAKVFNATNIGSITCPFKQNRNMFTPITSIGKYFKSLNQTITNYRYWSPRFFTGVPSKNFIIIDYNTLKESKDQQEENDYFYYIDELKYANPDVKYFVLTTNTNPKLFEEILINKNNQQQNIVTSVGGTQFAKEWSKSICNNFATLTYNQCFDKPSDGVQKQIYITPGYRQNWAMYPEFFLKSFNIEITIKANDGNIRFCYDREYPQKNQDYCKDITQGNQETLYINDPCKKEDQRSCRPFYITLWGKERKSTQPCLEDACQSMDQISVTISHKGISCNSAMKLGSMGAILFIQMACFALIYLSSKSFF